MKTFEGTSLEGKHPMDMIGRLALLDKLRQVGAEMVNRLTPKAIGKFLMGDLDSPQANPQINWEYALFVATDKELEDLMSNFIAKAQPNEQQSKLLKV